MGTSVRIGSLVVAMAAVATLPVVASAEDLSEVTAKKVEAPDPGVQTAKAQAPTWCKSVKDPAANGRSAGSLSRTLDAGMNDYTSMIKAAEMVCLWPSDPGVAHAVQIIVQHWMNWTGEQEEEKKEVCFTQSVHVSSSPHWFYSMTTN